MNPVPSTPAARRRAPATAARPVSWLLGPDWSTRGLRQPGWFILPLRAFLAVTFCVAGLQKLADPGYLDPHNQASFTAQTRALQSSSPIGPLLGLSLHAPTLVGLLIAFGELAVGIGALLGLWTRIAAAGGMLLSLTFFLTVSWNTSPYYYGSDIVFFFAWSAIAALGAGGVFSIDGWIACRTRWWAGPPAATSMVPVSVPQLRRLCGRRGGCGLQTSGTCTRARGCPVFPAPERLHTVRRAEPDRRSVLAGARTAAVVAAVTAAVGGLTIELGRLTGDRSGTRANAPRRRNHPPTTPPASTKPARSRPATTSPPGHLIGPASAVPAGQARRFTDPATGDPAWVVHPSGHRYAAYSAICTHAGCTVDFNPTSMEFICPCHGGTYDATTGKVLGGPPPAPLRAIPVHVIDSQIRAD